MRRALDARLKLAEASEAGVHAVAAFAARHAHIEPGKGPAAAATERDARGVRAKQEIGGTLVQGLEER